MASALVKTAAALAGAGVLAIAGWSLATSWHPSPARYPLQGIDLPERPSEGIEWGTVRAQGVDFVYLTATAGTDRRSPAFEPHWTALPDHGLRRGAVHLYSLCQSGRAQANAFNTFVPSTSDSLPMAVDLAYRDDCLARPDRAALVAELRRFLTLVESHTGKPVLLRLSRGFEQDYQLASVLNRPVWLLTTFRQPTYAARAWTIWRASDLRRIDGIEGPVNWNVVAP